MKRIILTLAMVMLFTTNIYATDLIGHRGYSGKYPENTMAAFKGAYKSGFDGIEADIWESDNGDLMIFHDVNTKDLTGRSSKIWRVNTNNRHKYKVKQKGRRELIPTFEETLAYIQKTDMTMLLHIKTDKKYRLSDEGVEKIVSLIKEYGVEDNVVIFASSRKATKRFSNKGVRLGILTYAKKDMKKDIAWLEKNGGDTLVIHKVRNIKDKSVIRLCHEKGIKVGTYWTYSRKEFRKLESMGADFAMANNKLNTAP